ncbi:hypothetical protein AtEden1_Chr1g0007511 [Arabidopsis thaliana]
MDLNYAHELKTLYTYIHYNFSKDNNNASLLSFSSPCIAFFFTIVKFICLSNLTVKF